MKVYIVWRKAGPENWDWDMLHVYANEAAAKNIIAAMEKEYGYIMKMTIETVYE